MWYKHIITSLHENMYHQVTSVIQTNYHIFTWEYVSSSNKCDINILSHYHWFLIWCYIGVTFPYRRWHVLLEMDFSPHLKLHLQYDIAKRNPFSKQQINDVNIYSINTCDMTYIYKTNKNILYNILYYYKECPILIYKVLFLYHYIVMSQESRQNTYWISMYKKNLLFLTGCRSMCSEF